MPGKSIRVFAGPNGSGKSTLFKSIKDYPINLGYFINADELESQLKTKGYIDLKEIGLKANQKELDKFLKTKAAKSLIEKSNSINHEINFEIIDDLIIDKARNAMSYEASLIGSFIRMLLYKQNRSFSFETVMSHVSKIDELRYAKSKGYRVYLYFICTDDAEINVSRVKDRVVKGGHDVNRKNIIDRYPKTLENLMDAIKQSRRAFLFDNSGKDKFTLIAETYENQLKIHVNSLPEWFNQYVLPNYH